MFKCLRLTSICLFLLFPLIGHSQKPIHHLNFNQLPKRWDEAIPLGNGILGALVWDHQGKLRFSLDRADLWDNRPMNGLHRKEFSFEWVEKQVAKKEYSQVQTYFDAPYNREPAPTKLPGAAMEFPTSNFGKVKLVNLNIKNANCLVKWENGVLLNTFVDANAERGWFKFEQIPEGFMPTLIPPAYSVEAKPNAGPVEGDDLARLGYEQGQVTVLPNGLVYRQKGFGQFEYQVLVSWQFTNNRELIGVWTIHQLPNTQRINNLASLKELANTGFDLAYQQHVNWWLTYWQKSAIQIPNQLLEKQWYLEQYKFGSSSRKGAPPISLQAIWTADNGRIPPWKGDFHHDLNTQLSYWPAYTANHLTEAMVYLDHLDQNKLNYLRYTKAYFGKEGLNVPGVTTIDGTEMGGWIQYALSPTISAWLSQHYYLQWRYSMNRDFLEKRAYPWVKETAVFLENISRTTADGSRQLPLSSSPEFNDNDMSAWFTTLTNYDLALMKFCFKIAEELAIELKLPSDAAHWKKMGNELPNFAISENQEFLIANQTPYQQSHRHFSHLMSIHPLGLIQWDDGPSARKIIQNSLHLLDSIGTSAWCGYSYAWAGNLKARAKDGLGAEKALEIFAKAFCGSNSFHLNGDQSRQGYSNFQYRPFTLEGNFAFAAGIQEMLIQSHQGFIELLPAVPESWENLSFQQLRTEGAFLVCLKKENGLIREVELLAEAGGTTQIKLPYQGFSFRILGEVKVLQNKDGLMQLSFAKGSKLKIIW